MFAILQVSATHASETHEAFCVKPSPADAFFRLNVKGALPKGAAARHHLRNWKIDRPIASWRILISIEGVLMVLVNLDFDDFAEYRFGQHAFKM
jgi:hypothetical protein